MKKSLKVLVVATVAFISFSSNAQIFGIEAGVGLSSAVSPDTYVNDLYGRTLGAKLGGTIEFDITDDLYLGSGLSFAKKGASTTGDNLSLIYVQIPLSARYNIFELGRSGSFYAASGFYLATPIGAKQGDVTYTIGEDVKGFDFGLNVGFGVLFNDQIQLGLSYEGGFLDFSGNENNVLKNTALLVTFGYKFGV
ncbi:outer membrane beta-barrel protein [Maribacter thermophilus]|uniref:outer membrane beta-barrel protein n=1 Tax=Maribacter thermophilus TaxID=1197874 RepID=UPI0006415549|nr:outer membrane beta-barrel protein [Maribacter thermophilus]